MKLCQEGRENIYTLFLVEMTNEMGIESAVNTFLLERGSKLIALPQQSLWKSSQLSRAFPYALRRRRG